MMAIPCIALYILEVRLSKKMSYNVTDRDRWRPAIVLDLSWIRDL